MQIYFLTLHADTQEEFIKHFESFARKHAPQRFDFAFDPEQAHRIHDYRILWRATTAEHIAIEVGINIIHLSHLSPPFHALLQRPLDGLFLVSNANFSNAYTEMAQLKSLMPPSLLAQKGLTPGSIYFREDIKDILPEDIQALSKALGLTLYAEIPQNISHVCADIVTRLYEKSAKANASPLLRDQANLPI
jgi:hypothetical protein